MNQLTTASLICGGGSMIILISILIKLPLTIQILLLLGGLAVSGYGVILLVKMIGTPLDKAHETPIEQKSTTPPIRKKRPTSTL